MVFIRQFQVWLQNDKFLLSLAIGIALLVRLAFIPFIQRVDWDGFFYLGYAQNILKGDWLGVKPQWTLYPLGYPLTIASVSLFGLDIVSAGLVVSVVSGVLTVIPVYKIAAILGGQRAAFFSALLIAVNPWLVSTSISIYSEALFILVWMCILWMYVRSAVHETSFWVHGATLVASLGLVMIRPVGIALLAGGVLATLLDAKKQKYQLVAYGVFLAAALVVYGVYSNAVSNHLEAVTGVSTPSYALQEISRGLVEFFKEKGMDEQVLLYHSGMQASEFFGGNAVLLAKKYTLVAFDELSVGVATAESGFIRSVFPLYAWTFAVLGLWAFYPPRFRIICTVPQKLDTKIMFFV